MDKVTLKKEDLLDSLRTNLDFHGEDLIKMLASRREEIRTSFCAQLKRMNELPKHQPEQSFYFEMPEDHTKDYEKAIKMAEMSVNDQIELTSKQFDQLVMDNWSWSMGNDLLKTKYLGK